jgi:hypothetical protein
MSINLHKVTANSWVANANGTPVGFIYKGDAEFIYMTPEAKTTFSSMSDIKEFLGGKVKEQISEAKEDGDIVDHIEGFPLKHTNVSVMDGGERPVYVRGKQVQHVAGFWTIKFSKRWVPSFCPLLKTVEQYQSAGPFKTRLEMMNNLSTLNRQVG